MRDTYFGNWNYIKDRFNQWWNRETGNTPLMRITVPGKEGKPVPTEQPLDPKVQYLNVPYIINEYRNYCETHYFLADAFPFPRVSRSCLCKKMATLFN